MIAFRVGAGFEPETSGQLERDFHFLIAKAPNCRRVVDTEPLSELLAEGNIGLHLIIVPGFRRVLLKRDPVETQEILKRALGQSEGAGAEYSAGKVAESAA